MKNTFLIFSMLIVFNISVMSQQTTKTSDSFLNMTFDLASEQNFVVNDLFSDKYINDLAPKQISKIAACLTLKSNNYKWGAWGKIAVGSTRSAKRNNPTDIFNMDLNNYYLYDVDKSSDNQLMIDFSLGGNYNFFYKKWTFSSGIGIGVATMDLSSDRVIFKEKNTNNYYRVSYSFNNTTGDLFFIPVEFKASYSLSNRFDLMCGVIYQQYITPLRFKATMRDYDFKHLESETIKGKYMSTIGFNLGIAYKLHK